MTRQDRLDWLLTESGVDAHSRGMGLSDKALAVLYEVTRYPKRRLEGQGYSDLMGAKLLNSDLTDELKQKICETYAPLQNFLSLGWWLSGQRVVHALDTTGIPDELVQEVIAYVDQYVSDNY